MTHTDEPRTDIYQLDDAEIAAHPIVKRLLREARADERNRIREALLSDGAIEDVEMMLDRLKWAQAPHAKAVNAAEIFAIHIGLEGETA